MQPGHGPVGRPLKRPDSHVAEQMVERAAELARDSHSQTRYAAVLVKDESLLAWGTNGTPLVPQASRLSSFTSTAAYLVCEWESLASSAARSTICSAT